MSLMLSPVTVSVSPSIPLFDMVQNEEVFDQLLTKCIHFLPLPCSVFLSVIMLVLLAGIFLLHLTSIILLLVATIDNVSNPPLLLLHLVVFMLTQPCGATHEMSACLFHYVCGVLNQKMKACYVSPHRLRPLVMFCQCSTLVFWSTFLSSLSPLKEDR